MATEETAPKVDEQGAANGESEKVLTPELQAQIIRQLEYYFGDSNLQKDKFLQEQIKADEDGWVPFATMCKFNRLKKISSDLKLLAEATKQSTGLLEVSEDGTKLRRSPEMPVPEDSEERRQDVTNRTIYAKGFPLDICLDDMEKFFDRFGDLDSVYMRKDVKRNFKGSVFVTFKKVESVQVFLKEETVEYDGKSLEKRLTKAEYYKTKEQEKKQAQEAKQNKKTAASSRQQNDEERYFENEMRTGALLYLTGFPAGNETTREDIRNMLQDYGPIAWVDYNKGDTECWIRYDQENKAKDVLTKANAAMNNILSLNGDSLEARVLEGEEETSRWKKMFQDIQARMEKRKSSKNFQKGRWGKRPSKESRQKDSVRNAMKSAQDVKDVVQEVEAEKRGNDSSQADGEPPVKRMKTEISIETSAT